MRKVLWQIAFVLIVCLGLPFATAAQPEPTNTVQAVLFYSPTCPHCQIVINETLIPLAEHYGDQLEIVVFDITQPVGWQFYQAAIIHFEIPDDRNVVPMLVVGDVILVGSVEIPDQFSDMIEEGLSGDGVPWPEIPGLAELLATPQPEEKPGTDPAPAAADGDTPQSDPTGQVEPTAELEPPTRTATVIPEPSATAEPLVVAQAATAIPSAAVAETEPLLLESESGEALVFEHEEPAADPLGLAIASVLLLVMVAACVYVAWRIFSASNDGYGSAVMRTGEGAQNWAIPMLALAGLGVAAYLAYVEITDVVAACGPVGKCNIVQSSVYAHIWGVPVALLGLITYIVILLLWLVQRYLPDRLGAWPIVGLMALTILGTLFSIYLTLLELFVIHAVCAWCLTSAVIMLLLMLLVVLPATSAPDRRVSAAV